MPFVGMDVVVGVVADEMHNEDLGVVVGVECWVVVEWVDYLVNKVGF